jgi:hypothetical protein
MVVHAPATRTLSNFWPIERARVSRTATRGAAPRPQQGEQRYCGHGLHTHCSELRRAR